MQISPDCSGAASSNPTSQTASMHVGSAVARNLASTIRSMGCTGGGWAGPS
jgi:hypothetical protein